MDAVTFYAFWNGSLVGDLFNAVVGITQIKLSVAHYLCVHLGVSGRNALLRDPATGF